MIIPIKYIFHHTQFMNLHWVVLLLFSLLKFMLHSCCIIDKKLNVPKSGCLYRISQTSDIIYNIDIHNWVTDPSGWTV